MRAIAAFDAQKSGFGREDRGGDDDAGNAHQVGDIGGVEVSDG